MKSESWKLIGIVVMLSCVLSLAAAIAPADAQTQKKTAGAPPADVKIRSKMTSGGNDKGMETILYVKGVRMRSEMAGAGMGMTSITQCDLKRTISVNDKNRTYLITPFSEGNAAPGVGSAPGVPPSPTATRRGGIVNVTNTVTDTGERKQMFGFNARHIKTSMTREASPDACSPESSKIETDGWYIDFQYEFDCPAQKTTLQPPHVPTRPDCEDEVRTKNIGTAKLGFPVLVTTTIYRKEGTTSTMTQEVIELLRSPLDAALFDVPAGYTLAQNAQELYGMGDMMSAGGGRTDSSTAADNPVAVSSPAPGAAAGMTSATTPKKEGAMRIGIVMPKAQVTAGDAARAAEAVRNTFAGYLKGPTVEVVALNARLPSQALEEAKQSQCDFVLYASLTQKKGGGGSMFGRALGNVVGAAAGHIPVNTAGEAAARSATITGIHTTASIASNTKAKDELSLEYKLEATDGTRPGAAKIEKAKARSDGEDVLTPLIQRAAEAIVAATKK